MKPGALLVNVARGPVVVTDALVDAVRDGHVRAALDVVDPEPLPPDHPLWTLDDVLITPHVGAHSTAMAPRVERLIRRQIKALQTDTTHTTSSSPRRRRFGDQELQPPGPGFGATQPGRFLRVAIGTAHRSTTSFWAAMT
jgi:phosphoglycerate dehydrogenase-like enzyme